MNSRIEQITHVLYTRTYYLSSPAWVLEAIDMSYEEGNSQRRGTFQAVSKLPNPFIRKVTQGNNGTATYTVPGAGGVAVRDQKRQMISNTAWKGVNSAISALVPNLSKSVMGASAESVAGNYGVVSHPPKVQSRQAGMQYTETNTTVIEESVHQQWAGPTSEFEAQYQDTNMKLEITQKMLDEMHAKHAALINDFTALQHQHQTTLEELTETKEFVSQLGEECTKLKDEKSHITHELELKTATLAGFEAMMSFVKGQQKIEKAESE